MRLLLAGVLFTLSAPLASAQILLGGDVYDGPGGSPLIANGLYHATSHVVVPPGKTLTIPQGVVIKFGLHQSFAANGTVRIEGVNGGAVIFTSIKDDGPGGDSNGDGNTTVASPGDWLGVQLNHDSDASLIEYLDVAYAGQFGHPGIQLIESNATIYETNVHDCLSGGMKLLGSFPSVVRCSFVLCGSAPAVQGVTINGLAGFLDNYALGTLGGDYALVAQTFPGFPQVSVIGDLTIGPRNCLGGVLVLGALLTVPTGATLTLEPGLVVKPVVSLPVTVSGSLHAIGTPEQPIVFTSFRDDAYAFDTNGDGGVTAPAASDFGGIQFVPGATTSVLRHVLLRFSGFGQPGVRCESPAVTLHSVRAERGESGYVFSAVQSARSLTAFGNLGDGFRLQGGAFDLQRVTSVGNGGVGIVRTGPWSGVVRSSIARDNVGAGFVGFGAGQVVHSNGSGTPAGGFNIDVDPSFVDDAHGDFRLQATSPCVDAGDPADLVLELDPSGYPSPLDGDFAGTRRVDMGAHEFCHIDLGLSGTQTPGGTLTVQLAGTPGLATLLFLGAAQAQAPFPPYGLLLVDPLAPLVVLPWPGAPSTVVMAIPIGIPTPLPIVAQALVVNAAQTAGHTSNVDVAVIE
jgi:hypothetical protein